MRAGTYAQPDGATRDDLEALVRGIAARPELVGISLADFVPAKDPSGDLARRLSQLLIRCLAG
jgi:arginase family enzyme